MWAATKVVLFMSGVFLLYVVVRWRSVSGYSGIVLAFFGGISLLIFVTYLLFGTLGYRIVGDDLKAPRALVWGFLFLLFVIAMTVFCWLYATDRIPNHAPPPTSGVPASTRG